jgi:hypothetical protein
MRRVAKGVVGTITLPKAIDDATRRIMRGPSKTCAALTAADESHFRLKDDATTLSHQLRALGRPEATYDAPHYDERVAVAYAAHRLPAIFAAVSRVLLEAQAQLPNFAPISFLDFGAGPGTATMSPPLSLGRPLQRRKVRLGGLDRRLRRRRALPRHDVRRKEAPQRSHPPPPLSPLRLRRRPLRRDAGPQALRSRPARGRCGGVVRPPGGSTPLPQPPPRRALQPR